MLHKAPELDGFFGATWATDNESKIILEWMLRKQGGKVWVVFIWLGRGTGGGLLWTR
jgi:hypothetical protein